MTDPDDMERRIAKLERDLAKLQAESTYGQIEETLVRQKLKDTLDIAMRVVGDFSAGFDATVQRMADDLNGSPQ